MRIISAALAVLLYLTLGQAPAQAGNRDFSMGSNVFGLFGDRSRIRRQRAKRARLARAARTSGRGASRNAVRRRKARRVAPLRRAKRRTVRRAAVRRTATRRKKVARKRKAAKRRVAVVRRAPKRASSKRRKASKRRTVAKKKSSERFARRTVAYRSGQRPGTIVVDTKTRHLYYVLPKGKAIRYGVAVGKAGFAWSGTSRIRRKVEWPTWTPPAEMIERKPELAKWRKGMPGGAKNPLGSRALYLYQGKKDTLYRIHGTNNPGSIGRAASSGCIRMRNEDVAHLYARVKMGSKVIVR